MIITSYSNSQLKFLSSYILYAEDKESVEELGSFSTKEEAQKAKSQAEIDFVPKYLSDDFKLKIRRIPDLAPESVSNAAFELHQFKNNSFVQVVRADKTLKECQKDQALMNNYWAPKDGSEYRIFDTSRQAYLSSK